MSLRRIAVLAVTTSTFALVPVTTAGAETSADLNAFDRQLVADINAARIERGIAPLNLSDRLTPIATEWSQQLASDRHLRNNPGLRAAIDASCPKWRKLGENVGVAGESTADDLFASYMRHTGERKVMLNPKFTWVGVHSEQIDEDGSPVTWSVLDFANHCS